MIWAGDMNMYIDPILDKYRANNQEPTETVKRIKLLLEECNMCDMWRLLNPTETRYTWRQSTAHGFAQSRLDYWITPSSLSYRIKECLICPSTMSDHSLITLILNGENRQPKGKGIWKLNTSLLGDKEYLKRINDLIEECKIKYVDVKDARLKWDVIKMDVRGSTISYSSYKAKQKRQLEQTLTKEILELDIAISRIPNEDLNQRYNTACKELELLHNETARGIQL
jgi:hypothetical protein